jgi:exosortase
MINREAVGGPAAASAPSRRGPDRQALAAGLTTAALLLLYVPALSHAAEVWRTDQEFSFAFLVPPFALFLLWLRRGALRAALAPSANIGLLPLLAGLVLLLVGVRSGIHAIAGASFLPTALGAAAYLYGVAAARTLFYPLAFFTASLSLYRGLLNSVGFTLQELTARSAARLALLLGVPVRRTGVDLFVGQFHFVVAEACSGLSSLLALVCLGALLVGLAQASLPRRLALIVLVLPIVLAANIIRVTLVLALARPMGLAIATGFLHGTLSAVLFLCASGLFFLVGSSLGCYPRFAATASS